MSFVGGGVYLSLGRGLKGADLRDCLIVVQDVLSVRLDNIIGPAQRRDAILIVTDPTPHNPTAFFLSRPSLPSKMDLAGDNRAPEGLAAGILFTTSSLLVFPLVLALSHRVQSRRAAAERNVIDCAGHPRNSPTKLEPNIDPSAKVSQGSRMLPSIGEIRGFGKSGLAEV